MIEVEVFETVKNCSFVFIYRFHHNLNYLDTVLILTVEKTKFFIVLFVIFKTRVLFSNDLSLYFQFLLKHTFFDKIIFNILLVLMFLSTFQAQTNMTLTVFVGTNELIDQIMLSAIVSIKLNKHYL